MKRRASSYSRGIEFALSKLVASYSSLSRLSDSAIHLSNSYISVSPTSIFAISGSILLHPSPYHIAIIKTKHLLMTQTGLTRIFKIHSSMQEIAFLSLFPLPILALVCSEAPCPTAPENFLAC
jgi:hypothetical protein